MMVAGDRYRIKVPCERCIKSTEYTTVRKIMTGKEMAVLLFLLYNAQS